MVLTCTMRAGATLSTVTGTTRLSSSQTWVIPTFSPTMALLAMALPLCPGAGGPRTVVSVLCARGRPADVALMRTLRNGRSRRSASGWFAGGSPPGRAHPDVETDVAGAGRGPGRTEIRCYRLPAPAPSGDAGGAPRRRFDPP